MQHFDVAIVGGGIAGISIGAELARDRSVLVLDMEPTLAFHTTGRSAAMYLEAYGGPTIRALTTAGRGHFEDAGLLSPMPALYVAATGRGAEVERLYGDVVLLAPDVRVLDAEETATLQPLLRADRIDNALLEPRATEIDVHGLHQGYVHALRAHGGTIVTGAHIGTPQRTGAAWRLGDDWSAEVVVDAAGAWADAVAERFGARPAGLRPLRRTAFMVDAPAGARPPMVSDVDEAYYVKPDAGKLLCSPADETPQDPADAKPDELEIARAIDAINEATTLGIRSVRSAWAGLRTFAADRTPIAGYDPEVEGFFWLAGQGGYGIQTAPALARTAAALLRGDAVDPALRDALARDRVTIAGGS